MKSVYSAVRTGSLNKVVVSLSKEIKENKGRKRKEEENMRVRSEYGKGKKNVEAHRDKQEETGLLPTDSFTSWGFINCCYGFLDLDTV